MSGPVTAVEDGRALVEDCRPASWSRRETWLWTGAVGAGVADLALTAVGLGLGAVEANPVARAVLAEAGLLGAVVLKLLAVTVGAAGWRAVPARWRWIAPVALAVPWAAAVAINAVVGALLLAGSA